MRRALLALSGIVICAGLVTALAANARFPQERVPDQTFKVVVYSSDADKVGSVTTRLR